MCVCPCENSHACSKRSNTYRLLRSSNFLSACIWFEQHAKIWYWARAKFMRCQNFPRQQEANTCTRKVTTCITLIFFFWYTYIFQKQNIAIICISFEIHKQNKLCLCTTAIFSKTVTLIFDLDWWPWTWYQQKGLVTSYTHVKYEGSKTYQSEDMANVKDFANKQRDAWTNRRDKNYMPTIYRCRGIIKQIIYQSLAILFLWIAEKYHSVILWQIKLQINACIFCP